MSESKPHRAADAAEQILQDPDEKVVDAPLRRRTRESPHAGRARRRVA